VTSATRLTLRWAIVSLCVVVSGVLSWVLVLGALGGNGWAAAGFVYGLTLSVTMRWWLT
jgi:hypothetical protein